MKHFIIAFFLIGMLTQAQESKEKKAADNYNDYAFSDAIESYQSLLDKGYSNEQIYKNLGNANYFNAQYDEAANWYEKLFELESSTIEPEYLYRYAQTLKSLEKYADSDKWMQKFKLAKATDQRAIKFEENTDYLHQIEARSGRYDLKNLIINSEESDFAPSFYNDNLVFSTARDSGLTSRNLHDWNNKSFLNLYRSSPNESGDYVSTSPLSKKLNRKTHESSTAFTKDGSTVYFTRNNSVNGKFSRDKEGVSRLKIYRATLKDSEWIDIVELPFNGDDYSVAHPTLNEDESKLYFASDMPGTYGASDIFVVDINSDGTFGTPRNLGNKINTEARETFPFVTDSDILYFSSDGHPGLGGLDVFATNLKYIQRSEIVNAGKPLNSEEDDFSFVIREATQKGFFASNRTGGKGSDDIYSFTELEPLDLKCHTLIAGIITDQKTGALLANTAVVIYDNNNEIVSKTTTDADGAFNMDGNCSSGDYKLVASKAEYNEGDRTFAVLDAADTTGIELSLEQIRKSAPIGTDLAKYLNIDPIYFDFDKSFIRKDAQISLEKIISYLQEFPEVKVQVGSHTDSRANDAYNISLSKRRAKATVEYLISKGITASRFVGEGFGETQLTNECSNGVPCSRQKHQANRRSEFIVIE
jgi:outer membrane protein OmpA-like peptidoglycan-associated protein/tetratricopeptide (TPR) repeat protein